MAGDSVGWSRSGFDINTLYSPASAATDAAWSEADEEAAIGSAGADGLLAVTVLELVGTTVHYASHAPDTVELGSAYGIVAAFAALHLWARTNPYPACIAGLALYVLVHLLAAVADPGALTGGLVVNLAVVYVLLSSVRHIQRYRDATAAAAR